MGLWLKQDDGTLVEVSGGGGGSFDGEHVPTGDPTDPATLDIVDEGQLLYDGVEDTGGGSGAKFISESVVVPANPGVSYSSVEVTFPEPFDAIPNITMTVQSGSAVYAEAANTTTTGFECVVRSTSALTRDAGDVSDRAIDRDYSVWYQATDDSTISRFGGGSGGGGGDAGPHDHDYLPLSGGTVTGDLTVDGLIDGRLGPVPADAWGVASGSVFTPLGAIGNSQGSYGTAMTSNGYRNIAGGWTSLGLNNSVGAASIELLPTGTFWVRTAATMDGSATNPPVRFAVTDSLTRCYYDLQVDGQVKPQASGTPSVPGILFGNDGSGVYGANDFVGFTQGGTWQLSVTSNQVRIKPDLQVDGTITGTLAFGIADGIDTQDVLERAETATMPALDDEGVATTDADVDSITVNEVVTAMLAKIKELSAEIKELKGA